MTEAAKWVEKLVAADEAYFEDYNEASLDALDEVFAAAIVEEVYDDAYDETYYRFADGSVALRQAEGWTPDVDPQEMEAVKADWYGDGGKGLVN
jgi:hypothetical protein